MRASIWLRKALLTLVVVVVGTATAPVTASASLIRDAEIENTIRTWATPLLQVAGLGPDAVRIRMIRDPQINAFVTQGNRMFINTGLLMKSESAGQVIGVIAHEIGHIAGGHMVRLRDSLDDAATTSLLATIVGIATGIATGRGDVGTAIAQAGNDAAMRGLFAFTRVQESSADAFALRALDATNMSSAGLLEFFDILGDQEMLLAERQDPYVRTHPLTRDRVAAVRAHAQRSSLTDAPLPAGYAEMHARVVAKLVGFLEPLGRTMQRYPERDTSLPARYARAIAHYRRVDLASALPLIDGLIAEKPDDPYFHELKGQMLFETGRLPDALAPYREAVRLAPDSALLRLGLGHVLVELGKPELLAEAQTQLQAAVNIERDIPLAWQLLATAFGRAGDTGMAAFAMAESSLLSDDLPAALFHAGKAERLVPSGSPAWLQLQDIRSEAERRKERKEREG